MSEHAAGFQKQLGLFDSAMLVAGSMIGSGIYIVSAGIARDVGTAGWLLAVWAAAGLITVLGALSYAELAAMMPHAGGQYVYLREAYGPLWGFLYGWTSFTVIQTGTIAAVGVAFAKFLGVFVRGSARGTPITSRTSPTTRPSCGALATWTSNSRCRCRG
jgi:APA family basic amino acid/polyamine antiporter